MIELRGEWLVVGNHRVGMTHAIRRDRIVDVQRKTSTRRHEGKREKVESVQVTWDRGGSHAFVNLTGSTTTVERVLKVLRGGEAGPYR